MRVLRKSERSRAAAVMAVSASLLLVTGCSGGSDEPPAAKAANADPMNPEQGDIRVLAYEQSGSAAIPVAMESGIAEEYGISIDQSSAESSSAMLAQVVSGAVPIAGATAYYVLPAVEEEADVRIIGEGLRGSEGIQTLEVLDEDIQSPKDLEGKRVGSSGLLSGHQARVEAAVKADGGDPSKVEFVNLPWAQMVPNLQQGQVDAVSVTSTFQRAARSIGTRPIMDYAERDGVWTPHAESSWIVNGEWADANPNTVAAFQCAVVKRGSERAMTDDEAYESALRAFGYDEEGIEADIRLDLPGTNEPQTVIADMLTDLGWIEEGFDVESITIPIPDNC